MPTNAQLVLSRIQAWNKANPKARLDPKAVLAVASSEGLGGGIGDQGTSFGPFQLHIGGALPRGITRSSGQSWAWSPEGIDYALRHIASVAGGQTGAQAVTNIVSRFERPANPSGEITRSLANIGLTPTSTGYQTSQGKTATRGSKGARGAPVPSQTASGVDALAALLLSNQFQPPQIDSVGTLMNPAVHHETPNPPDSTEALTLARQFLDSAKTSFSNPGFAQYLHGLNGISLPSSTLAQSTVGTHTSSPRQGDLAFFGRPPAHQGVMLDEGHVLHSTNGGTVLRVSALSHPAYLSGLATVRRI